MTVHQTETSDMVRLLDPLIPALRRYARALMRERSAADDLVQDCLERVITHWHQRRQNSNVRSWAFAILHNLAINRLKQTRRRGTHLAMEDADEANLASAPTQEDRLLHREVLAALDTLPEDQKSVLLLVSVEDLSYAETARVLDVPVGTVMSRLSRARERLRQQVAEPARSTRPLLRRIK